MDSSFAGRRALVTGSTRGVGIATARRFLAEGAEVVLHGRSDEAVAAAVTSLGSACGDGSAATPPISAAGTRRTVSPPSPAISISS